MQHAAETLDRLDVPHEVRIVSAHRTPDRLADYAKVGARPRPAGDHRRRRRRGAPARHVRRLDRAAGAGRAGRKPRAAAGMDSLLSIVQMPAGIPVGTLAIGRAGAVNAGLLAAAILAGTDPALAARLDAFRAAQTACRAPKPPAVRERTRGCRPCRPTPPSASSAAASSAACRRWPRPGSAIAATS